MSKSKARFLAELLSSDGKVIKTKSQASTIVLGDLPTIPNSKLENSSVTIAGEGVSLGASLTLNTGDVTEHTAYKYYTDARARASISATGSLSYDKNTGVMSFTMPAQNTSNITEGSNLYYTDTRARAAISATGSLSYNSTTGVMSFTMPAQNTSNITEGSNLYFTNARADARIVNAGSANWNTAYGWGNHASAGYVKSSGNTVIGTDTDLSFSGANVLSTIALTDGVITAYTNRVLTLANLGYTGETNATADQTNAEIRAAVEAATDSNVFTNADHSKLDGIATGATNTAAPHYTSAIAVGAGGLTQQNFTTTLKNKLDGIAASANNYVLPFTNNSSNWNTAYGWGDHASAGYTNDQTAAEILAALKTVDGSGSGLDADLLDGLSSVKFPYYRGVVSGDWDTIFTTASNQLQTSGLYQVHNLASGHSNHPTGVYTYGGVFAWQLANSTFKLYSSHLGDLSFQSGWNNDEHSGWRRILTTSYYGAAWTSSNDGAGSGLDADLLDGQHGSYYRAYANLTGTPTIPSLSGYATESYVGTQISNLVDSSPAALNTLNELAAAIGDDASFSTTVTNNIATKAPLASPTFTGTLIAPIIRVGDGNDGRFYSDTAGRTAFANGDFYIQDTVTNYFNYATNQYHGNTSGDNHFFRGNALSGNSWSITAAGVITAAGGNSGNWNTAYTVANAALPKAGGTLTGTLTTAGNIVVPANTGLQTSGTETKFTTAHGYIQLGPMNTSYAHIYTNIAGGFYFNKNNLYANGNTMWTAGNDGSGSGLDADLLDGVQLSSLARVDAGSTYTNYGNLQRFYSNTNMATTSGGQSSLECFSSGSGNDAFMTFHVGGDYATYFGLDGGTNKLSVGGWSMGAASYEIYHAGNKPSLATLGYTGATNANYITNNNQLTNGAGYITASGNAATATSADTIDSWGFVNTGSNSAQNSDNINSNGISYYTGGVTNFSGNATDGALYSQRYSNSWQHQIAGDYRSGQIALRGKNNGTWTSWNKVWTAGNDGSGSTLDADLLDGQHGSYYYPASNPNGYTNDQTAAEIQALVKTRFYNDAALNSSTTTASFIAELIADYGCFNGGQVTLKVQWSYAGSSDLVTGHATIGTIELAGCTIETWGGTYKHVRITRPNTGAGGHGVYEYNDQSSSYAPGWREIWTSESDGAGSGLDADLLDGQQGSYYYAASNPSGYQTGTGTVAQSHYVSGTAFATNGPDSVLEYAQSASVSDTKLAPSTDWHNSIRMGHGDPYSYYSSAIAIRMTGSGPGDLYTQTIQGGTGGGWSKHWSARNDGSGSGLDADLLDGNHASAFLTAEVDTLATVTGRGASTSTEIDFNNDIHVRNVVSDNNYGEGMFGVYASTRHQHVWSMGEAYKLNAASGTSVGNLYGLSYTHTNVGTGYGANSAAGLGHQLNGRANGTLQWALGDGAYFTGTVKRSGHTMWDAGNDGSGSGLDADLLDGVQASALVGTHNGHNRNIQAEVGALHFYGDGLNSGQSNHSYAIYQEAGAWSHPYPDLRIAYHTGIKIGGHYSYNGTRFYNNSDMATELLSVGNGDNHVRVAYNLYRGGNTVWDAGNDGAGSGLVADYATKVTFNTQGNSNTTLKLLLGDTTNSTIASGTVYKDNELSYNTSSNTLNTGSLNFQ